MAKKAKVIVAADGEYDADVKAGMKRPRAVTGAVDPAHTRAAKVATGAGGFGRGREREAGMMIDTIHMSAPYSSGYKLDTYRSSYAMGLGDRTGAYDIPTYFVMMNQQNGGLLYWPTTLMEKYSWYRYWARCFTNPNVLVTKSDGTEAPLYTFKSGDRVINRLGLITEVDEVTTQIYNGEVLRFEVEANGWNDLEVTPEHPFYVLRSEHIKRHHNRVLDEKGIEHRKTKIEIDYNPEWLEAKDIREGDMMIVPATDKDHSSTMSIARARLLGYYASEGNINFDRKGEPEAITWSLGTHERVLLDEIKALCLEEVGEIPSEYNYDDTASGTSLRLWNRELSKWMLENGGTGSHSKKFSESVFKSDDETVKHIVGCWLNGDGNRDNKEAEGQVDGVTCSGDMAHQLFLMMVRVGLAPSKRIIRTSEFSSSAKTGESAWRIFLPPMYANQIVSYCKWDGCQKTYRNRKYNYDGNMLLPVRNISTRTYSGLIWNISTKGATYEERTFLVYGMVTHNTDAFIGRALELLSDLPMSKLTLNMPKMPRTKRKLQQEIMDFFTYQLEVINGFEMCQSILWEHNCFKGDVSIATSLGVVPISDVRAGDSVLSASGTFDEVVDVNRRHIQERLVDINIARLSGIEFQPTAEHPILVLRDDKETMIKASEVRRGDWVGVGGISTVIDRDSIDWFSELQNNRLLESFYGEAPTIENTESGATIVANYTTPNGISEKCETIKDSLLGWLSRLESPVTMDCYEVAKLLGVSDAIRLRTAAHSLKKNGLINIQRTSKGKKGGSSMIWHPCSSDGRRDSGCVTRQVVLNTSIGSIEVNEDFLYLLGYWMGDGWLWHSKNPYSKQFFAWDICISEQESELTDRVNSIAKSVFGECSVTNDDVVPESGGMSHVVVEDSLLCMWWNSQFGHDCKTKKLPRWVMELPSEKAIWILKGMVDSDGFISKKDSGGIAGITGTNKNLLMQLFHLGLKCGIPFTFNKAKDKVVSSFANKELIASSLYSLTIGERHYFEKIAEGCSKAKDVVWSENHSIGTTFCEVDGKFYYRVNSIERPYYDGYVYNFEVKNSHTYCANGVRTHNCIGNVYIFMEWDDEKKMWSRAVMLPPEEVYIFQYPFSENKRVEYRPERLIRMIRDGATVAAGMSSNSSMEGNECQRSDLEQKILEHMPTELVDMVRTQGCIVMDTDPMTGSFVHHIARRKSPYLDLGASVLERVLVPMLQREHYKYCQLSLASRNMTPKNLITAPGLMPEDVDQLRTQVDLSYLDPEYSVITNYAVEWQQIGTQDRMIDFAREYENIESQIFAAMGVTRELMTGEGTFTGSKITVEILNTMFLMSREILKNFIERKLFVPICEAHGWFEEGKNGVKKYWYPQVGFNRITIRDNSEVFDSLFQLYQKGSLPVDVIYELFNLNVDEINAKLRNDLFTVKDPTSNRMNEEVNAEVGRKLVDRTDVVERVAKYLGFKLKPEAGADGGMGGTPDGSGGGFADGFADLQGEPGTPPIEPSETNQITTPAEGDEDVLQNEPEADAMPLKEEPAEGESSADGEEAPVEEKPAKPKRTDSLADAIHKNLPEGADDEDIAKVVEKISELEDSGEGKSE